MDTYASKFVWFEKKVLKTTSIESLPDDAMFDILVRISAHDICNAAIFVCRTWRRVIRTRLFTHAHLHQSTHDGLIIHRKDSSRLPVFFLQATRKGQIEITNMHCEFTRPVMSSCNGLVLEPLDIDCRDLRITNPSTKQHFALPLCPHTTTKIECCGIAYSAADMKYKVVRFFYSGPRETECAILTVGVDTDWGRRVDTQHLPLASAKKWFDCSLTTGGFVHWTNTKFSDFLSLNVETEIITQNSVPTTASRHDIVRKRLRYYYLAMGSNLSLLITHSYLFWEVWEMKPETGEWTQMPNIDLEPHQNLNLGLSSSYMCWFVPVGWSSFRDQVLLFRVFPEKQSFHVAYNVRTQEIISFDQLLFHFGAYFIAHKNTLMWL